MTGLSQLAWLGSRPPAPASRRLPTAFLPATQIPRQPPRGASARLPAPGSFRFQLEKKENPLPTELPARHPPATPPPARLLRPPSWGFPDPTVPFPGLPTTLSLLWVTITLFQAPLPSCSSLPGSGPKVPTAQSSSPSSTQP